MHYAPPPIGVGRGVSISTNDGGAAFYFRFSVKTAWNDSVFHNFHTLPHNDKIKQVKLKVVPQF